MRELDPDGSTFRVHDTGKDVEVVVTVDGEDGLKDFDKGDGLKFIDSRLGLELKRGPHLVCGDTVSDIPMLKAVMDYTDDVYAIFVTRDPELVRKVLGICPDTLIVPSPDILLTILGISALSARHLGGKKGCGIFP